MEDKYYIYCPEIDEILEYYELESFLECVVDENHLEDWYNEYFGNIDLPIIGQVGTGTILKKIDRIKDCIDYEISYILEDLEDQFGRDDIAYFDIYTISKNKNLLLYHKTKKKSRYTLNLF